jgi:hypothetical protein
VLRGTLLLLLLHSHCHRHRSSISSQQHTAVALTVELLRGQRLLVPLQLLLRLLQHQLVRKGKCCDVLCSCLLLIVAVTSACSVQVHTTVVTSVVLLETLPAYLISMPLIPHRAACLQCNHECLLQQCETDHYHDHTCTHHVCHNVLVTAALAAGVDVAVVAVAVVAAIAANAAKAAITAEAREELTEVTLVLVLVGIITEIESTEEEAVAVVEAVVGEGAVVVVVVLATAATHLLLLLHHLCLARWCC